MKEAVRTESAHVQRNLLPSFDTAHHKDFHIPRYGRPLEFLQDLETALAGDIQIEEQ